MKKTILFLLSVSLFMFVSIFSVNAQTKQTKEEKSLLLTLYYETNQIHAEVKELLKLKGIIKMLNTNPSMRIQIDGYGDPQGGEVVNERVSHARAKSLADFLSRNGVSKKQIVFKGNGIDTTASTWEQARRVDMFELITVTIEHTPKPKPEPKKEEPKREEPKREPKPDPVAEPVSEPQTPNSSLLTTNSADGFYLRTNLLYWLVGNINLGVEYRHGSMGYLINGGYSPFEKSEWNNNLGSWFVAPEVRYYLGEREAWFIGAQFLAGGYNYKLSDTGYKGTMIGGGVTGGYKITLSSTFDMDFSLGLGYGTLNYDSYYKHENGTNVYVDKDVTKNTFIPVQLGISLSYKLGVKN